MWDSAKSGSENGGMRDRRKLPGHDLDEEEEEIVEDGTKVLREGHLKNDGLFIDV